MSLINKNDDDNDSIDHKNDYKIITIIIMITIIVRNRTE